MFYFRLGYFIAVLSLVVLAHGRGKFQLPCPAGSGEPAVW